MWRGQIVDAFVIADTHRRRPAPDVAARPGHPLRLLRAGLGRPDVLPLGRRRRPPRHRPAPSTTARQAGYHRIGYLGWPEGVSVVADARRAGWHDACRGTPAGAPAPTAPPSTSSTRHARRPRRSSPTSGAGGAIVCASDVLAVGALHAVCRAGLRPGVDVGVVGFDDSELARMHGLTSVSQPMGDIAAIVLRLVAESLAHDAGRADGILLKPGLTLRASTARRTAEIPSPCGSSEHHHERGEAMSSIVKTKRTCSRRRWPWAWRCARLSAAAAASRSEGGGDGEQHAADGPVELNMLIASSGDAETNAVQDAVDAVGRGDRQHREVTVASDMDQELAQGFASGSPADVFYLDASLFADYAAERQPLRRTATRSTTPTTSTSRCATPSPTRTSCTARPRTSAPSRSDQHRRAGRRPASPTPTSRPTWDELASVAEKLTTGDQVGPRSIAPASTGSAPSSSQNGGWWLNDDGTEATGDRPRGRRRADVRPGQHQERQLRSSPASSTPAGAARRSAPEGRDDHRGQLDQGRDDQRLPRRQVHRVAELPEGPAGKGTLLFTQCWGIAADSDAQAQAVELVNSLTTVDQQLAFAEAFGVMPSRQSAAGDYESKLPRGRGRSSPAATTATARSAPPAWSRSSRTSTPSWRASTAPTSSSVMEEFDTNAERGAGLSERVVSQSQRRARRGGRGVRASSAARLAGNGAAGPGGLAVRHPDDRRPRPVPGRCRS